MVKSKRPVIVLTPQMRNRADLVTVVPLSTVKPNPVMSYHYMLPKNCMPQIGMFQKDDSWVKGDMILRITINSISQNHDGDHISVRFVAKETFYPK